jgi:photosystem II stability/assembly factor-like uncharacterized protein
MLRKIFIIILFIISFQTSQAQWIRQKLGTLAWFKSVYFLNENTGWIVGGNGSFLSTSDGGKTWKIKQIANKETINDVYFSDEKNGWLLCERNRFGAGDKPASFLLKTSDSGETWEKIEFNTGTGKEVLQRFFFGKDGKNFAIGDMGSIFQMQDTQNNWKKQITPFLYRFQDIAFTDKLNGVVVGGGGTILFTEDGGESWNQSTLSESVKTKFNSVFFINKQTGWAVGAEGKIFTTNTGGKRWRSQNSNTATDLTDVYFNSSTEGWAIGNSGKFLRTMNGGNTWNEVRNNIQHNLEKLIFVGKTGWAVGFGGTILRYDGTANSNKTRPRIT